GPSCAFILCLSIIWGQSYEVFLTDTIYWCCVAAMYLGIRLFQIIWFGYKLIKGTHFVRYSELKFPQNDKK
ncbi:lysine transporter, partial [Escherichia coli]